MQSPNGFSQTLGAVGLWELFQLLEQPTLFLPLMARFKNINTAASSGRNPREELELHLPCHSFSLGINEPSR
jgi:hypothetical protein